MTVICDKVVIWQAPPLTIGIYGPGTDSSKVGIGVSEDTVTVIGPGNINGFQGGVLATGAKEFTMNSVSLQNNEIAEYFLTTVKSYYTFNVVYIQPWIMEIYVKRF